MEEYLIILFPMSVILGVILLLCSKRDESSIAGLLIAILGIFIFMFLILEQSFDRPYLKSVAEYNVEQITMPNSTIMQVYKPSPLEIKQIHQKSSIIYPKGSKVRLDVYGGTKLGIYHEEKPKEVIVLPNGEVLND